MNQVRLLKARGLSKAFGGLQAVNRLELDLNAGEIVGLVGPNGAGKTTIFNLLTGFLRPDTGTIEFKGENLIGLRPDVIANRGLVRTFQLSMSFPKHTLLQSVLAGYCRAQKCGFWNALLNTNSYRVKQNQAMTRATEVLKLLDLTKWKDTLVDALPCGVQRSLGIGQAIMAPTELLLVDEPFNGLNEQEIAILFRTLDNLRSQGTSIFVIGHHIKAMMSLCKRIVVIDFGIKVAEGTPEEIRADPTVIKAYLGSKGEPSHVL